MRGASIVLVLAAFAVPACGGGGGHRGGGPRWEALGTRVVDFGADKDTIHAGLQGRFVAIAFEIDSGNVDMYNIRVNFGDDSHFSPTTRVEFKQGSRSRVIDLPGDARIIKSIEFWYRSELRRGRGTITAFGRHP